MDGYGILVVEVPDAPDPGIVHHLLHPPNGPDNITGRSINATDLRLYFKV